MLSVIRTSALTLALFTVSTGVAYPLLITGLAQALFPDEANGSLVQRNGHVLGSRQIGQLFDDPRYFSGRPSATTPPYNARASGGSNLGPSNPRLHASVRERIAALKEADPGATLPVPADLVTTSGSGLDPDISPAAAKYQAARVARARGLPLERVLSLIEDHREERTLGLLGEPRVNVLLLNLALDDLGPRP